MPPGLTTRSTAVAACAAGIGLSAPSATVKLNSPLPTSPLAIPVLPTGVDLALLERRRRRARRRLERPRRPAPA